MTLYISNLHDYDYLHGMGINVSQFVSPEYNLQGLCDVFNKKNPQAAPDGKSWKVEDLCYETVEPMLTEEYGGKSFVTIGDLFASCDDTGALQWKEIGDDGENYLFLPYDLPWEQYGVLPRGRGETHELIVNVVKKLIDMPNYMIDSFIEDDILIVDSYDL